MMIRESQALAMRSKCTPFAGTQNGSLTLRTTGSRAGAVAGRLAQPVLRRWPGEVSSWESRPGRAKKLRAEKGKNLAHHGRVGSEPALVAARRLACRRRTGGLPPCALREKRPRLRSPAATGSPCRGPRWKQRLDRFRSSTVRRRSSTHSVASPPPPVISFDSQAKLLRLIGFSASRDVADPPPELRHTGLAVPGFISQQHCHIGSHTPRYTPPLADVITLLAELSPGTVAFLFG